MPAPTSAQLEQALTQAYLSQGFVKQVVSPISGELVPSVPPVLPDYKTKEVRAQATALSQVWATWQLATIVNIPVTSSPGSPSAGVIL